VSIVATTSHVGWCVKNLDLARRFYVDGLGFEDFAHFEIDRPLAEMDGDCDLTSWFVQKDGLRVELLYFRRPSPTGTPSSRRTQLGLTHLSFVVEDVDGNRIELMRLARGQAW
jgi:catechol 2,3-dioxygenase-like lactoylglutathione lyase family enzyme